MRHTTLSVTTGADTQTFTLNKASRIEITSAWFVPGERCRHAFAGFREVRVEPYSNAGIPSPWSDPVDPVARVSGLSFDAGTGEITVTEAGNDGAPSHGTWTRTTVIPVDAGSELRVFGARVSNEDGGLVNATVPLAGVSAISITEAS